MTDRGVPTTQSEEAADLFGDFVDAVLDLMRAARRTGGAARTAQEDGISVPQLVVISAVDAVGDRGVSAVADRAGLAQPTVTRALATLERRGMVVRTPHSRDGRSTCIALTAAGQVVLKEKRQEIIGHFAELWKTLGPEEREHAVSLVSQLSIITDRLI